MALLLAAKATTAFAQRPPAALIIGNGAYASAALPSAPRDAQTIARRLETGGYDVTTAIDVTPEGLTAALDTFGRELAAGRPGLLYYQGYAIQHRGDNILLPLGTLEGIRDEADLLARGFAVTTLLRNLAAATSEPLVVMLDAAYVHPLHLQLEAPIGLAPPGALPAEVMLVYSSAPNQAFNRSFFAAELVTRALNAMPVELLIRNVGAAVRFESGLQQRPNFYSSLSGPFILNAAAASRASPSRPDLVVSGSNTIGDKLLPALLEGFFLERLGASIDWQAGEAVNEKLLVSRDPQGNPSHAILVKAHGSSTGFRDYQNRRADLIMSSRPVRPTENPASLVEHVLALDGVAVVVSPDNPLDTMSVDVIADIFSGRIRRWEEIGGAPGPIAVFARDDRSGTYATFEDAVLSPRGLSLVEGAVRLESTAELAERVAADPRAIGQLGLAYIGPAKGVRLRECAVSYDPTPLAIKTEDYPLSRRLYLYGAPRPEPLLEQFIDYALSDAGQALVAEEGFVDLAVDTLEPNPDYYRERRLVAPMVIRHEEALDHFVQLVERGFQRLPVTFRFEVGRASLDSRARPDIARISRYMQSIGRGQSLVLLGFADIRGGEEVNRQLSLARAQEIARALSARGVRAEARGYGEDLPVACNSDEAGFEKNRRVEVWVGPS
ncbi:MAG: substrate-binding domain-containing protein [Candidatus Competibacterales bacterium]